MVDSHVCCCWELLASAVSPPRILRLLAMYMSSVCGRCGAPSQDSRAETETSLQYHFCPVLLAKQVPRPAQIEGGESTLQLRMGGALSHSQRRRTLDGKSLGPLNKLSYFPDLLSL